MPLPRTILAPLLFLSLMPARPGAASTQAPPSFAEVQDTRSHPIRLGCGEHVGPVGYVLYLRDALALDGDQVGTWSHLVVVR